MDIGRLKLNLSGTAARFRDPAMQEAMQNIFSAMYLLAVDIGASPGRCVLRAGETIAKGQAVTIINSQVVKANKDTSKPALGIAMGADQSGKVVIMLGMGYVSGLSGLTPGSSYYLGTAGAIQTTKPGTGLVQGLGFALSATEFFLTISQP